MTIPATIKIGGFQWTVEENDKVANEGGVYGSTHHTKQRIFLEPNETQQKKEQTFLHEVMHAIWDNSGLSKRYKRDKDGDIEEEIMHALSNGLYQVLKDNDLLK